MRNLFLIIYVVWNAFFSWMPYAVYKRDANFKAHAVPANARLISHFYQARSISGVIKYRVGDYVYTKTVGLSKSDSARDADFSAAVLKPTIPVLYDSRRPSDVVADYNKRFSSRTYLNGYVYITAIALIISSAIFLPAVFILRLEEGTRRVIDEAKR